MNSITDNHKLYLLAVMMSQELQEFVDDAIVASDDPNALASTQELLKDWDKAIIECQEDS